MRDPKKVEGGRWLLFERLVDKGRYGGEDVRNGPRPSRVHETSALKESVKRELAKLLNTRSKAPLDGGGELSVLDYGLPNFAPLSARSGDDRARLSAAVTRSIEAFEPRLRQVRVTAEGFRANDRALILRLDAVLVVGEHTEAVSFPLPEPVSFSLRVGSSSGEVEVGDAEEDE
jgi:type VI secretion system protein ImpF